MNSELSNLISISSSQSIFREKKINFASCSLCALVCLCFCIFRLDQYKTKVIYTLVCWLNSPMQLGMWSHKATHVLLLSKVVLSVKNTISLIIIKKKTYTKFILWSRKINNPSFTNV